MSSSNSFSQQSEVSPKVKFTIFKKLPAEVRIKIWKLSFPGPRIIELRFVNNCRSAQHDFVTKEFPALLHVCSESRQEALKSYEYAFGNKKCAKPVYFNFDIDILHLRELGQRSNYILLNQIYKVVTLLPDRDRIQRLSVTKQSMPVNPHTESLPILLFPALKEIIVGHVINKYGVGYNIHKGCLQSSHGSGYIHHFNAGVLHSNMRSSDPNKVLLPEDDGLLKVLQLWLEANQWGEIEWKEPTIHHKGLCVRHVRDFYCPPHGLGRAAAKRALKAAEKPHGSATNFPTDNGGKVSK